MWPTETGNGKAKGTKGKQTKEKVWLTAKKCDILLPHQPSVK